jgi:CdiI immunity protein
MALNEGFDALMQGYFHQDWPIEGETTEEIVRRFADEAPRESVIQARQETRELLRRIRSDIDMGKELSRLGIGVYPPGLNMTNREWLALVDRELTRQINEERVD